MRECIVFVNYLMLLYPFFSLSLRGSFGGHYGEIISGEYGWRASPCVHIIYMWVCVLHKGNHQTVGSRNMVLRHGVCVAFCATARLFPSAMMMIRPALSLLPVHWYRYARLKMCTFICVLAASDKQISRFQVD